MIPLFQSNEPHIAQLHDLPGPTSQSRRDARFFAFTTGDSKIIITNGYRKDSQKMAKIDLKKLKIGREEIGLIEKKLEDPEYRKRFYREYEASKIGAQILYTLERKGMTYEELAHATGTQKSNISRDLRAGGIFNASFSRISRIAEALGMRLVALLIPE